MGTLSRRQFMANAGAMGLSMVGLGFLAGCGRLPFQQPAPPAVKVRRLGFLNGSTPAAWARTQEVFRQALADLGYVEGQNLAVEYRWGEGSDARLTEPATELARLPVDV